MTEGPLINGRWGAGESCHDHWHYQVYGQCLCSNVPLPELPRATFARRNVSVSCFPFEDPVELLTDNARLINRLPTDLGCDLSLFISEPGYLLRFEGFGDFLVSCDGRKVTCQPLASGVRTWLLATLYNLILSYTLYLQGVSNFHASAVLLPTGGVGFMGPPGTGKSTLAAGFVKSGYSFLSDDVLAVRAVSDDYQVSSGFPYFSLSSSSRDYLFGPADTLPAESSDGEKLRVSVRDLSCVKDEPFNTEPVPLRALFVLKRGLTKTTVTIDALSRAEAIKRLLDNTNCLSILPQEAMQTHLSFVSRLSDSIPVYELSYPSDFEGIWGTIDAIVRQQEEANPIERPISLGVGRDNTR